MNNWECLGGMFSVNLWGYEYAVFRLISRGVSEFRQSDVIL
jgi:hypothetical protein